jgi:hypothetical protein
VLPTIKLLLFNYVFLIEKVVAGTQQAWGDFENELETILAGDPIDEEIFGPSQELTLAKIVEIIAAVDRVLTAWLIKLSEIEGLTEAIATLADTVASTDSGNVPTIDQIRDDELPEGWKREAVMFVMLSHLHVSVRYVADAIGDIFRPVDSTDPKSVTVAEFLTALGFQLDGDEVERLLDRDFDEMVPANAPAPAVIGP